MKRFSPFLFVIILLLFLCRIAYTQDMPMDENYKMHKDHEMNKDKEDQIDHSKHMDSGNTVMTDAGQMSAEELRKLVGVDEKLGQHIPLDLKFTDEEGKQFQLSEFIDRPTLLLLIFYHCPLTCNIMLGSLTGAVNKVNLKGGQEYKILTLSFDDEELLERAVKRKTNYLKSLKEEFPKSAWKFAIGDKQSIMKLVNSLGYKFKKQGKHSFVHPNVLISLAPDGKIIRYLYGPNFIPFDVAMSVTEAARGTPGVSIKRLLTYCFSYDSKGKAYVFNTMRVVGIAVLLCLSVFLVFLLRKRKPGKDVSIGSE